MVEARVGIDDIIALPSASVRIPEIRGKILKARSEVGLGKYSCIPFDEVSATY